MEKTSRLLPLYASLLVGVGLMVGSGVVRAESILSDDFESYNDGALSGQGPWTNYYPSCTVAAGKVYCDGSIWQDGVGTGTELGSGEMTVSFKWEEPNDPTNENIGGFFITNYGIDGNNLIFNYSDGVLAAGDGLTFPLEVSIGEWHTAKVVWDRPVVRWYIDGILAIEFNDDHDLSIFGFRSAPPSSKNWVLSVDDIGAGAPFIGGYNPILTPTFPVRNTENFVDFSEIEIEGKIEIPTGNDHLYHTLVITFRKPDNFLPGASVSIDVGDLTAGKSYQYHATTTIPITSSGDNFFKIGYSLLGSTYAGSYANNSPIVQELLAFDNTWIKDSASAAPTHLISQSIKPSGPEMEDCSIYSGTDKAFCEFRNFITGAFMPSDEALGQIGATMNSLKNKFPMNYINAIAATFSDIKNNINDSAEISFHILGAEGVVNTDIFSRDIGGGITLGQSFKLIFTFMVLVIFMYWGIGYMHRILKF